MKNSVEYRRSLVQFLFRVSFPKNSSSFVAIAAQVYNKCFGSKLIDDAWKAEQDNTLLNSTANIVSLYSKVDKLQTTGDETALPMDEETDLGSVIQRDLDKKYLYIKEAILRVRAHKRMRGESLVLPEGLVV